MSSNYPPGVTGNEPQITGEPEYNPGYDRVAEILQLTGNYVAGRITPAEYCMGVRRVVKKLEEEIG